MEQNDNFNETPGVKNYKKGKSSSIRVQANLSSSSYIKNVNSGKKEAVLKVASHGQGKRIKEMLNYIGGTEKDQEIELEDQNGVVHKGKKEIEKVYNEWEKTFTEPKKNLKRKSRDATHIILSADAKNNKENLRKVHQAGKMVASEIFNAKGYDYLIGLHQDGAKPHIHIVCKTYNREPKGKKLRLGPREIQKAREIFAEKLTELGLEHIATRRIDRPKTIDRINKGLEKIKNNQTQFKRAIARSSPNKKAFEHKAEISKSICQLRALLKKDKEIPKEKRMKIFGELRKIERSLTKNEKNKDRNKKIYNTMKLFGKSLVKYSKEINDLTGTKPKKIKEKSHSIKIFNENVLKNIRNGKKEIIESPIESKNNIKEILKLEKKIKNIIPKKEILNKKEKKIFIRER